MAKTKSVIWEDMEHCAVCGKPYPHIHHIFFGTANRKISEIYGYVMPLCAHHHNMSKRGVHFNKELDVILKSAAQRHFEANHGTREEFIKIFGRSYL